ncbi:PTS sugar transporter subunit IIA [Clostridium disporicum]|jgi:PTS system mannose-specific IIA component|uniref:PTS system mannose/fructose/sorbose family transporter subunit IIA n=1 Tax=Clostridium disporicum TaxID=84024 RepID=A0A174HP27_9CLOT|nr:mannose/fructose/sorbose PTS transporter subunit IIA [Clostridium disporicum]CUO76654.1 PTS system mannose/fructose/sorbose family transporter subunit IIA [Clostridium disporicum]
MVSLIIGTHGSFSRELINSAELIYGKLENVNYITFLPGEGQKDLIDKYNTIINKLDKDSEVLFLVDLFGGSPFNTASMLSIDNVNMDVVTGVNLPMLLEVYSNIDNSSLEELVSIAVNSAQKSICSLKKSIDLNREDDDLL